MKLQIDRLGAFVRVSLGEHAEAAPTSASPIVQASSKVVDHCGGWEPGRSVLVGHWAAEPANAAFVRRVVSATVRTSLLASSTFALSEVGRREELEDALVCSWQLPRLLVVIADHAVEDTLQRLPSRAWTDLFENELPRVLLETSPSAVIFGFYHQRWMSAFVPAAEGARVTEGLITSFPTIQEVRDEL